MSAVKKPLYTPGQEESKLDVETRRFNKRALIGSVIIHLFFFLLKVPQLHLEHKLKDDPKLIPIKMEFVTPAQKNPLVRQKVEAQESAKVTPPVAEKKIDNGSDRVVKNSDRIGDKTQKVVQDVQKGDPGSKKYDAYKPGTDVRKAPRTTVGSGSAPSQVKAKDGNTGGSGDTYQGFDMTNVTNSIRKSGQGLKRVGAKGAKDDGGAGFGTGGGIGNGVGGGGGDGFITGSPNGTADMAKVATNIGSLTGSAKGKIDSSRGFEGLATKGSITMAGIPVEKIARSTINPDDIRRILRDHIPQFRSCYQRDLDKSNGPEGMQGRVDFVFTIASSGAVSKASVTSEDIQSDVVRGCIVDVLKGIRFPAPGGTSTVDVRQPMNFYPKRI